MPLKYPFSKIPLNPPFPKWEIFTPLWQRGVRGDFIKYFSIINIAVYNDYLVILVTQYWDVSLFLFLIFVFNFPYHCVPLYLTRTGGESAANSVQPVQESPLTAIPPLPVSPSDVHKLVGELYPLQPAVPGAQTANKRTLA